MTEWLEFFSLELRRLITPISLFDRRVVGRCRKCMKLDNDARLRHDYSEYRAMLKELRRSEESFEDGSKIAYLLQVNDATNRSQSLFSPVGNVYITGKGIISEWCKQSVLS